MEHELSVADVNLTWMLHIFHTCSPWLSSHLPVVPAGQKQEVGARHVKVSCSRMLCLQDEASRTCSLSTRSSWCAQRMLSSMFCLFRYSLSFCRRFTDCCNVATWWAMRLKEKESMSGPNVQLLCQFGDSNGASELFFSFLGFIDHLTISMSFRNKKLELINDPS